MSRPAAAETLGMTLGFVAVAIFAGTLPATRLADARRRSADGGCSGVKVLKE